jgi:hypothetical protein
MVLHLDTSLAAPQFWLLHDATPVYANIMPSPLWLRLHVQARMGLYRRLEAKFLSQQFERGCRQLLGILTELLVKVRIIVGVHAALEGLRICFEEPRGDA